MAGLCRPPRQLLAGELVNRVEQRKSGSDRPVVPLAHPIEFDTIDPGLIHVDRRIGNCVEGDQVIDLHPETPQRPATVVVTAAQTEFDR